MRHRRTLYKVGCVGRERSGFFRCPTSANPSILPWPMPAHAPRITRHLRRAATQNSRRSGFTLIEILVVIVVIAILATLVAPNIFKNVGEAKSTTARAQIENLSSALDAYRLDNGTYPTTQQGLDALTSLPTIDPPANWKQPYLRKAVPNDPWGKPYIYIFPGESNPMGFDLISYGADGKLGGEGEDADILSWK